MYVDKPMRDHTLMQAIARVNRVFKDKPGGLIVDYIGIADDLKKSLRVYSDEVRNDSMISIDDAIRSCKRNMILFVYSFMELIIRIGEV